MEPPNSPTDGMERATMFDLAHASRWNTIRPLLIVLSAFLCVSCPAFLIARDAPRKPKPPLAIEKPRAPSSDFHGQDLSKADGDSLARSASLAAEDQNYRDAVPLQYWAVQANDNGRYDLACYLARIGEKDAAFYWLQEAALNDGVDASWAVKDPDLVSLRKDLRWLRVLSFLKNCNAYWAESGLSLTTLVLPKSYKPGSGQPIGAVVGLHGLGGEPSRFVNDGWQAYADQLNRAIIGVSGTVPRGSRKYVWSEDPAKDAERIRKALKDVSNRVTVKPGDVVTFGFSQGAQMAFEVALKYPDEFRGAIVMSPGTVNPTRLSNFESSPMNRHQGYICVCGAGEFPGNVAGTKADAEIAKRSGAKVELKLYPGVTEHAFPPDFGEKFVEWVNFIADAKSAK